MAFAYYIYIIDDLVNNYLLIIWGRRTASPDKKKTQKLFRLEELIIKNLELLIFIQIVLYIRVNKFLVPLRLVLLLRSETSACLASSAVFEIEY